MAKSDRRVQAVFAACLLPALWLALRAVRGDLGADPVAEVLNRLGYFAFVLLVLCLACTPLQLVLGRGWPLRFRRVLGDFSFAYACAHLLTWLVLDRGLDLHDIVSDLTRRRFIMIGMATWILLLPLAVTSTQGWVRRLGFRRWKRLHRLVYAAGTLACVHFIWRFKTALREPLWWSAAVALLLLVRAVHALRARAAARTAPAPGSA